MRYINELKEDEIIVCHYLCKQKMSLKSRNGKTYLSLKLQDKTGIIDGKVWDLSNDINHFEENDFICIEGVVLTYQNDLQIKISKIRKSAAGEYDPADYIPRTDKDISALYCQLTVYIDSINDPWMNRLLTNLFIKNTSVTDAFMNGSAAKTLHHSYLGGLIEHTCAVVTICDFLCTLYDNVNRDLLVCAAMLHDIGKVYELSPFPDNSYTDEGQLLGHIYIGAELISKEARMIDGFPENTEKLIKHCIISHHGEYEYGSPKRPKIIEAFILYCADNLDAKANTFKTALNTESTQNLWAGYIKGLDRYIRKTDI